MLNLFECVVEANRTGDDPTNPCGLLSECAQSPEALPLRHLPLSIGNVVSLMGTSSIADDGDSVIFIIVKCREDIREERAVMSDGGMCLS